MHNPRFRDALSEQFDATEVQQIVDFVEKGFSLNGEIVVVSVFFYAKEHGKSLDEVFAVCEAEWMRSWKYQHPDIKGDPDAPGAA